MPQTLSLYTHRQVLLGALGIMTVLDSNNVPNETAFYENGDHFLNHDDAYDRLCKDLSFYKQYLGA